MAKHNNRNNHTDHASTAFPQPAATPATSGGSAQQEDTPSPFCGLLVYTTEGQMLYFDPQILTTLGYTLQEAQAQDPFSYLSNPNDQLTLMAELRLHGTVDNFSTLLRHADGSNVPVILSAQQMNTDGRGLIMVQLQNVSIRSQKRQQAESRYHLIFTSVPVGITITDKEGNFYAFNPAFYKMLGYTPAELRQIKSYEGYENPQDRQRLVDMLAAEGSVRDFETSFMHKDGRVINVLVNSDTIDFRNVENAMLSSVRDITALKSIERKLTKARDFSEAVLDTSDSLIMVYDKGGRMIKFNKSCEKITGYSLAELQETPFFDLLSIDPQAAKARIERLIETRECESFECYWKTRNGRTALIRWSSAVLKDEDGSDYIISTGNDITERRKAHEAVRQANRELEKSLQRLEEKNQAISLLADMQSFLQGCGTVEEACTVCAQFVQSICPETSGALYLMNETGELARTQELWGDDSVFPAQITASGCSCIQRRRMNLVDPKHSGLDCPHTNNAKGGQHLCIPMEANGEILGVLQVHYISALSDGGNEADSTPYIEPKLRLLTTAAEAAALTISNIHLQNTLRQQSIRDMLTGIYNRRYMLESLAREISRAVREQASVSVLMFDIDHFKDFNDTYGHDGGDTLLRILGAFLKQKTRGEDIISRYGGEEFVVVLPNTRLHDALEKAEALRAGVSQLQASHLDMPMRSCTISVGVASYPQNGQTADELLKAADESLYTAKREGRNRVAYCRE